jgi:hypothetical protein
VNLMLHLCHQMYNLPYTTIHPCPHSYQNLFELKLLIILMTLECIIFLNLLNFMSLDVGKMNLLIGL